MKLTGEKRVRSDGGITVVGKTEARREKIVPVTLFPSQTT